MEVNNKNITVKAVTSFCLILVIVGICFFLFQKNNDEEKLYYATFIVDGIKYQDNVLIENGYIVSLPTQPKKEGYTFDYWEVNGQKYDESIKITNDTTLTAVFRKNDDTESIMISFVKDNGEKDDSIEVIKNNKITPIENPIKKGYEFLGWYLNNEKFDFNQTVSENITLTAKWKKLSFNINFDSSGGNKVNSQQVSYGDKVKTPSTPTKEGYKFIGWYLNNQKYDFNNTITKEFTLIAKWEKVEVNEKIVYGDVNEDGIVNHADLLRIANYIEGTNNLTEQSKKNADVNADKKINNTDKLLLAQFLNNWYKDTLPTSPIKDYVLYGDVNEDGLIEARDSLKIAKHLEMGETLTAQAKKNADVNADGKISNVDAILIAQYVSGLYKNTLPTSPIKDYILYGDVNEDGVADTKDALKISSYIGNNETLTTQGKKNADVNVDGKINNIDMLLIMQFVAGWYENTLPTSPIKDYVLYGDVNEDGASDINDVLKISNYLAGNETLTTQGKKNADANADGNVNNLDMLLIMQFNSGWHENTLPASPIKNYVLYGDVYEDGIVDTRDSMQLQKYLNNTITLSTQSIKNSDINNDGKVNKVDLILLDRYLADWYENTLPSSPIKDYVLYGDVNEDGLVDGKDSVRLQKHLNATETLGTQGKKNADVNADGSVNDTDYQLLLKYLVEVEDGTIPSNPLK